MVQYITFSNGRLVYEDDYSEGIWINIVPPHQKEDIEALSERLSIPLDFLTDPLDIEERARYEREDDCRLIILSIPYKQGVDDHILYSTIPLGIILTKYDIITVSPKDNIIISRFIEERVKNFNLVNKELFVLKIMEQTAIWFLEYLKRLNVKRNLLEQELYNSSRNQELKELLKIEKSLVYFLNSLKADELLLMKMNRTDFLKTRENEEFVDYFEDIIVDFSQGLDMANVHTNILSGIMDTYATIISNNFNIFIQRLTFVTIILQVPTLIASFYGMNIKLPFAEFKYLFFVLLFVSLGFGITLVFFLIKRIRT